jgi:glutamine---fructose-6-phosphate transaminase (isomerizing)
MNSMLQQIQSLPSLIREIVPSLDEEIRTRVDHQTCLSVKRIYLTGCGDSHHASLEAEMAFEELAGIPTEALTALQFARYAAPYLSRNTPGMNLVAGISVSGEVSRTLEALQQGKAYGATILSLTATPGSRIGQAADILVRTTTPDFPDPPGIHTPGIRTYSGNQLALYLLAIRIGEVRGNISSAEASSLRSELQALGDAAEETIDASMPVASGLAKEWGNADEFVFTGGGPNFGSALFSAAKVLEASGDPALGQDTEEWAHLQYFARQVNTPTFVISAGGRELSRSIEVVEAAKMIGRRVAVICPPAAQGLTTPADTLLPLASNLREMFSPLVASIPGTIFAAYRAEEVAEPYFRNFGGGRSQEGGGGISRIRTSDLLEIPGE